MRQKITKKLFVTGTPNRFGMTESDYQLLRAEITGVTPVPGLKRRLRVYYKNTGPNLKHYMSKYFSNFFKSTDNDYSSNSVVFICDSEDSRNKLFAILDAIRLDTGYEIPNITGGGDNPPPPPPTGGGGDNPPPTGGGGDPKINSKTTTYLIIAGVAVLVVVLLLKFLK